MPTFGTNFAVTATNVSSGVASDWTINTSGLFANDGIIDSATTIGGGKTAELRATNFQFNIPTNSGYSLAGITATIRKAYVPDIDGDLVQDYQIQLIDSGGNLIGINQAKSGQWPNTTLTDFIYGSPTDTWGLNTAGGNGAALLSTLINTPGFGLLIMGQSTGTNQDSFQVDSVNFQINTTGPVSSINNNVPLFIHGLASGNSNIPLFTWGSVPFSGNIPLYTKGLASGNANIPLYMDVVTPFSGNIPLFIDGGPHISKCYGEVFPTNINTISGAGYTPWVNPNNALVLDNSRATATMSSGGATTFDILSFFNISGISSQAQISGVIFNFYKQQNAGDDSVIDRQVFLIENGIVQSGINYAAGIWGIDEHSPVSYSITQDQNGNKLQISDIMASGFGVLMRAGTNNFGAGVAQIDAVSCTVCATVPGITNSIPLFLNVSNNASGNLPLYIGGLTTFSGSLPLYIHGLDTFSGSIPLFINGLLSNSGNIPLYLQSNSFQSGSIPLYTIGNSAQSGGITLYLQGQHTYPENKSLPLYLGNFSSSGSLDSLRHSIPLYLDSHDFNGGITLYLGVSNIGDATNSATLFTKGAVFNSAGSIPLFLNNSGLTHSIPLYVKGLSYGTNPYINTDGYYPFEGGITLYIANNDGANSIPLYIGANFNASGNIPMFLAANNMMTSGIPLYMATSQPMTKTIPLYHHGF